MVHSLSTALLLGVPLDDWQFWVATALMLAAAYAVARPLMPKRGKKPANCPGCPSGEAATACTQRDAVAQLGELRHDVVGVQGELARARRQLDHRVGRIVAVKAGLRVDGVAIRREGAALDDDAVAVKAGQNRVTLQARIASISRSGCSGANGRTTSPRRRASRSSSPPSSRAATACWKAFPAWPRR